MNTEKLKTFTIIMIDNFDSFTYNLVNQLKTFVKDVKVFRNDTKTADILDICDRLNEHVLLVLSPGPGSPKTAGNLLELLQKSRGQFPILGVCLGHQAIVESYGGKIGHAKNVVHGKSQKLDVLSAGDSLFKGITPFTAARYHSLSASEVPDNLQVLATCDDEVMLVKHTEDKVFGLQFHPESILTPNGSKLMENILTELTQ